MYESVCIFDRLFGFFIRLLQDVRLKALSLVLKDFNLNKRIF